MKKMFYKKIEKIRCKIFIHINKLLKNNIAIFDGEKNPFNNFEDFLNYIEKDYLNNRNNEIILFTYNFFKEKNGFTKKRFFKKFFKFYITK